jgi:hypothetical protein
VRLVDGAILGSVEWNGEEMLGENLRGCEDDDFVFYDVASGYTRHAAPGMCTPADGLDLAPDASLRAHVDRERVVVRRLDGAEIVVSALLDVEGVPHAIVHASDGAFWVESEDELERLVLRNQTVCASGEPRTELASSPEMRGRFYRPSLLADFFEGRPLPAAGLE